MLRLMRFHFLAATLCACAVLAGCSRSGDFGEFVLNEVGKHGGHARTNVPLPKLPAKWRVRSDEAGFRATVTGVNYTNLDAFLHLAFGTPKISIDGPDAPGGQSFRVWGAIEGVGVAIELVFRSDDESEVNGGRHIRDFKEVAESITNAP